MTDERQAESGFRPPYVAFKTLDNLLDRLGSEAMPPRIDKGYLNNLSGGTQSAVLATLRTFNLIEDGGQITETLAGMAENPEYRREQWRRILREFYADQLRLAEENATAQQLEESFRGMGISGSTVRKAIVFYLAAVEYAGAPNSPHFRPPKQPSTRRRSRLHGDGAEGSDGGSGRENEDGGDEHAPAHIVTLTSGGSVKLVLNVNFFTLSREDRDFVNDLASRVQAYEENNEERYDED